MIYSYPHKHSLNICVAVHNASPAANGGTWQLRATLACWHILETYYHPPTANFNAYTAIDSPITPKTLRKPTKFYTAPTITAGGHPNKLLHRSPPPPPSPPAPPPFPGTPISGRMEAGGGRGALGGSRAVAPLAGRGALAPIGTAERHTGKETAPADNQPGPSCEVAALQHYNPARPA